MGSSGRWLPDDIYAIANAMVHTLDQMIAAVRRVAETNASTHPDGMFVACIVLNAKGEIVLHPETETPLVFALPNGVASIDYKTGAVQLYHPDQHLRPAQVARLAGVDKATVYRAVADGKLPAPAKPSERVSVFKIGDVQKWMATRAR